MINRHAQSNNTDVDEDTKSREVQHSSKCDAHDFTPKKD